MSTLKHLPSCLIHIFHTGNPQFTISSLSIIQSYNRPPPVANYGPCSTPTVNKLRHLAICLFLRETADILQQPPRIPLSHPTHQPPRFPQALGLLPSLPAPHPHQHSNQSSSFTTDLLLETLEMTLGNECKLLQPSASLGCVVPFRERSQGCWGAEWLALFPQYNLQSFQKEIYRS